MKESKKNTNLRILKINQLTLVNLEAANNYQILESHRTRATLNHTVSKISGQIPHNIKVQSDILTMINSENPQRAK